MARVVPSQVLALIDLSLTDARPSRVSHDTVANLTAIAHLVEQIPSELLSISGRDYSDVVCGIEAIRNSVLFWQHKGVGEIGMSEIRGKSVLRLLRDALAKCPDQIPSQATAELQFITDTDLRNSIRLDISNATSALHNTALAAVEHIVSDLRRAF